MARLVDEIYKLWRRGHSTASIARILKRTTRFTRTSEAAVYNRLTLARDLGKARNDKSMDRRKN